MYLNIYTILDKHIEIVIKFLQEVGSPLESRLVPLPAVV